MLQECHVYDNLARCWIYFCDRGTVRHPCCCIMTRIRKSCTTLKILWHEHRIATMLHDWNVFEDLARWRYFEMRAPYSNHVVAQWDVYENLALHWRSCDTIAVQQPCCWTTKILYFLVAHSRSGVHCRFYDDTITIKHNHVAQWPHARILHYTAGLVIYDHVAVQAYKCTKYSKIQ